MTAIRSALRLAATVGTFTALACPATAHAATAGTTTGFTTQILHFAVNVGPGGAQPCDIVGELWTPLDASPSHRVPAVLTTNGFGGSYTDQTGLGNAFASHDYAVLSYSGLGFGGSGCKIYLDQPAWDGEAASQLVSFLGGADGIAYTDQAHTNPVAGLDYVVHDRTDHAGNHDLYDPRVGMIGGSYGGEVQFAAASVDPRIDALVPFITWNSLNYSLAPNNAGLTTGLRSNTPGATKSTWAAFFSADGFGDGIQGAPTDPSRLQGCPNFDDWVCPALVQAITDGYPDDTTAGHLDSASVQTYMGAVKVPTLLLQGENDTLFNLNEAVATYQALQAQGTPVKMVWQSWGHSSLTPAPGELDLSAPDPATQYEAGRVFDWFDHYLAGDNVSTGPNFAYFRDWVGYTGNAAPAYASSSSYPVGTPTAMYLSGNGTLVADPAQATTGTQSFVTPPGGVPTGVSSIDVVNSSVLPYGELPDVDVAGTYAAWNGPTLTAPLDVVGEPTLTFSLSAPVAALTQAAGPAGQLVLFAKLYDVNASGQASLVHGLIAPFRVADVNAPITVHLPGIAHRFPAGDHLMLVVAGGDLNYRGGLTPTPVTIAGGDGQVLTLPVTG